MDRNALIEAMKATAAAKPVAVEVPGWGTVYVRQVTIGEVEDQTADEEAGKKKDKRRLARAAARVICDVSGARTFDPDDVEDVSLISSQPWELMRLILEASQPSAAGKA